METEKALYWVCKDADGVLRPLAFIAPASGKLGEYVQPDIDKFLSRQKGDGCTVVKVELVER